MALAVFTGIPNRKHPDRHLLLHFNHAQIVSLPFSPVPEPDIRSWLLVTGLCTALCTAPLWLCIKATAGVMNRLIGLLEQPVHLLRPLVPVLLPSSFQFTEVKGVAQGMRSSVLKIGFPVVVTEDTLKIRQNPDLVQGLAPTFRMGIKIAETFV